MKLLHSLLLTILFAASALAQPIIIPLAPQPQEPPPPPPPSPVPVAPPQANVPGSTDPSAPAAPERATGAAGDDAVKTPNR